jgi:predicted RNA-binding protein YlqC (UPF0109 family)
MDKKWRSGQRDGSQSHKKGRSGGWGFRDRPSGPVDPSPAAEELAEYILKVLSRDHEGLQVTRESSNPAHIRLLVNCDPTVTGRLIGKGGKTITALRLLVKAIAQKRGKRVDVEVSS